MIQAWLADGASGAAARILAALRDGESRRIERELARAAEVCEERPADPYAAERAEVLEAVVSELRRAVEENGGEADLDPHASLLAHLAGM